MSRPTGITKIGNEYADALGAFYAETPKAVLAAVLYSFTLRLHGEDPQPADIRNMIANEWRTLHVNGIVPQPAPKSAWAPSSAEEEK